MTGTNPLTDQSITPKTNALANQTVTSKYGNATKTDRGTKILSSNGQLSKDSFLTILCAQLKNQDPSKDQDASQYVSQLAQFASLEQMQNLNTTMSKTSYYSLIGKGVTVSDTNSNGVQYTGIVKAIKMSGNNATLSMLVNEDGKNVLKDFNANNIVTTLDVEDYSLDALNSLDYNMAFLMASNFTGKYVEAQEIDAGGKINTYNGTVLGATKENGSIKVKVKLDNGEIKSFAYQAITKVQDKKDDNVSTE